MTVIMTHQKRLSGLTIAEPESATPCYKSNLSESEKKELLKIIGANLRFARIKKGLTYRDITDQLSISEQTIRSYELGTSTPNLLKLIQLCAICDVTVDILMTPNKLISEYEKSLKKSRKKK